MKAALDRYLLGQAGTAAGRPGRGTSGDFALEPRDARPQRIELGLIAAKLRAGGGTIEAD
jgi:hypothetical protein